MKTRVLVFFIFSFIALNTSAQSTINDVRLGEVMKFTMKTGFNDLIFLSDDGTSIYALQRPYNAVRDDVIGGFKTYQVARYSIDELNLVEAIPLDLTYEGGERKLEFTAVIKNEIYLFTSFDNQAEKSILLFVERVDKNTLQTSGSLQKIAEIDYSEEPNYRRTVFDHKFSEDGSKMLISYQFLARNNENLKRGFRLLDDNLTALFQFDRALPPGNDTFFSQSDFVVTNSGEILVLGKLYEDKLSHDNTTRMKHRHGFFGTLVVWRYPNFHYQAYHINRNSEISSFSFKDLAHFITDMVISTSPDDKLMMAGFYTHEGEMEIKGVFNGELNLTAKQLTNLRFNQLDLDFLTLGLSDAEKKRYERTYHSQSTNSKTFYDLDKLVFYQDGGYALVAQPFHHEFEKGTVGVPSINELQYKDIWVIKHDHNGGIAWKTKVQNTQYYDDFEMQYLSYGMNFSDETIRFTYNQNKGTPAFNNSGPPERASLHSTVINREGQQSTEMILPDGKQAGECLARGGMSLKSGDMVFSSFANNRYRLLVLRK